MTVGRLLATGLGLLLLSLLLVLELTTRDVVPSPEGLTVQAWAIDVSRLVGAGLVVSAAVLHAVQRAARPAPKPPSIDHYA